jgi:general secretion pathway protein K
VLWLSAALAAIAFSVSTTVRSETDRASTAMDGLRAYYLANSALERAQLELLWSVLHPEKGLLRPGIKLIEYHFATGDARVEVIPEASKLDVNHVPVEMLYRLCLALGIDPTRAQQIAAGIDSWRRVPTEGPGYQPGGPSFQFPHASFQEIEELLLVPGITPDIFYGTYLPAPEGAGANGPRLVPRQGLADCLSVFGSNGSAVDANAASPAVLIALGLPPQAVALLLERRRALPFTEQTLGDFLQSVGANGVPLRVEGRSIITYRATARLRLANGQLSDLRRTVAEQVKYMPAGYDSQIHILRWYDTAWSN